MRVGLRLGLSLLLAVGLAPLPARAESAAGGGPVPSISGVPPTLGAEAEAQFRRAISLLESPTRPNLEEAYAALQSAYEQSQAWQLLTPLAEVARKLDRPGEALRAYEAALSVGGAHIDAEERARVERELGTLKARTAWLTVSVAGPPGPVTVTDTHGGEPGEAVVTNVYRLSPGETKIGLSPGSHQLSFTGDGGKSARLTLELQPGTVVEKTITLGSPPGALTPSPPKTKPVLPAKSATPHGQGSFVPFYISAGVTGALLGATIYTGVTALEKHSQFNAANDGRDPQRAAALRDQGTRLNLVTDAFIGATALGAVLSVVFYQRAVNPEVRYRRPIQKQRPRTLLGVQIGALRGGSPHQVTFSGEF
ncbi:MAG: hypothetical protein SFV15_25845 [Polyangiaceae bacterium]|nr:hypothetical protein [Polyangiaceae bacterium]